MAVDLSALPIATMSVEPLDFGGLLTPPLGGPEQRIERPGSRWTMTFETPPMEYEPHGRLWSTRLERAARVGALIEIPQPGFDAGTPGNPVVATPITAGKLIALSGLASGYRVREGQWLSLIVGGRRYADRAAADAVVTSAGAVTIQIENLLRAPLAGGETVEIAQPKIEGWLAGDVSWPIDRAGYSAFRFTVREAA